MGRGSSKVGGGGKKSKYVKAGGMKFSHDIHKVSPDGDIRDMYSGKDEYGIQYGITVNFAKGLGTIIPDMTSYSAKIIYPDGTTSGSSINGKGKLTISTSYKETKSDRYRSSVRYAFGEKDYEPSSLNEFVTDIRKLTKRSPHHPLRLK